MRFAITNKGSRIVYLEPKETIKCCECEVSETKGNYWYWSDSQHEGGLYCRNCAKKPTVLITNPTFWAVDNFEFDKR